MKMFIDINNLGKEGIVMKHNDLELMRAYLRVGELKAFNSVSTDATKQEMHPFDFILLKEYINSKKMAAIVAGWFERNFIPPELYLCKYHGESFFGRPMGHILELAYVKNEAELREALRKENQRVALTEFPYRLQLIAAQ